MGPTTVPFFVLALAASLTLSACGGGGGETADTNDAPVNVAGRHEHVVDVEDEAREVIVYVPQGAAGRVEAPVVFMFHGTSGDGQRFYNISGWREKADEEGLIAVFPSALFYCFFEDENADSDFDDPGENKTTTKWAAGKLGNELPLCTAEQIAALPANQRARADHPLRDDVAFFDAILDLLETEYTFDASRVYSSGFSNGGAFSSMLAAERSTGLAAAAAAAGMLYRGIDTPAERSISMVVSIGGLDDGFRNAMGVEAIPLDESLLDLPVATGLIDRYLGLLQLTSDHTFEASQVAGQTVSRFTYSTSTAGADNQLQFVIVEGLAHQYANGDNHPIAMVDPLWSFFSGYALE